MLRLLVLIFITVSCVEESELKLSGVSLKAFEGIIFSISDPDTLSEQLTNDLEVSVNVYNDEKIAKWCITESDVTPQVTNCPGGQGSLNGWSTVAPETYTLSAGDGKKIVYLWVIDSKENLMEKSLVTSIKLDTVAPIVTLNPVSNISLSNKNSVTIDGTCNDTENVRIDVNSSIYSALCFGNSWAVTKDLSVISDGNVQIQITQTDLAGNTSTPVSTTVIKDTIPPSFNLSAPINGGYINASNVSAYTFSGTCTEDGNINISDAISNVLNCSGGVFSQSIDLSGLGEGARTFTFNQVDSVGNPATTISINLTKDTSVPVVTLNTPANINLSNVGAYSLSGSCSSPDNVSVVVGGQNYSQACNSNAWSFSQDTSTLSDGSVTISVSQVDLAGNSSNTETANVTKDTVAPSFSLSAPINGGYINASNVSTHTFSGTCTEDGTINISGAITDTLNCSGGVFSKNIDLSALSEGSRSFNFDQTDTVGNSATQLNINLIKDTVIPSFSLSTPSDGDYINASNVGSFTFSGTCSEDGTIIISGDLSDTLNCSGGSFSKNIDMNSLAEGAVSISLDQTDAASNTATTLTINLTKDTLIPSFVLSTPSDGDYINASNVSTYTFSGTCTEDGSINISGAITDSLNCSGGVFSKNIDASSLSEGAINLSFDQTDAASNAATTLSINLTKDTVLPTVSFSSPAANSYINNSSQGSVSVSGSCSEDTLSISFTGAVTDTVSCSGGSFTKALDFSAASEGTVTLNISHSDAAGNSNSVTRDFIKDSIAPNLTQPDFVSGSYVNSDSVTMGGSCEDGLSINISGTETSTATCSSGTWSHSTSTQTSDGTYSYQFTQTDAAGNATVINSSWKRDTVIPTISTLQINDGALTTINNNTLIDLTAGDDTAGVYAFCLKYNDTVSPVEGATCWKTLESIGEAVTTSWVLNDYPYILAPIGDDYAVRLWIMDSAKNISVMSNVGNGTEGSDLYTINYNPDPPPVISYLVASSTDSPSSPLTTADTTITIGNDIYVKWTMSDDNPIPSGNITLSYTEDDITYTTLQSGLNNGVNGACSISGTQTGCVHLAAASPLSSFYKIKLEVQDTGSNLVLSVSNALNTGSVNFLSGNTSLGIGGSATSAILVGRGEDSYTDYADTQALAVTKTGTVFFNYNGIGLTYIDPVDGILKVLIPDTNSISGDGGPAASATVNDIIRITLDHNDDLLIYDTDQIRKVDLASADWTITTIAGGGANPPENENALLANLPPIYAAIFPTPNGNIYFSSGKDLWYYEASTQTIKKQCTISGTGTGNMSADLSPFDLSTCPTYGIAISYDKATSALTKAMVQVKTTPDPNCGNRASGSSIGNNSNLNLSTGASEAPHPTVSSWSGRKFTGLDGKLYLLTHQRHSMHVYDPVGNTWTQILGSGTNGRCADGTAALSCNVYVMSAFVSEFGKIYFLDMGVIRYVDDSGNVQTIAGQPRNFGVGENPISARYSQINYFDIDGDDVYVKNVLENQIVKFSLTGGNLVHIAGDGSKGGFSDGAVATTTSIPNCGWSMPCAFKIDTANNRLYHNNGTILYYLDLTTGQWVSQGLTLMEGGSRSLFLGYNGSKLLSYTLRHMGGDGNHVILDEIDPVTPSETFVFGRNDVEFGQSLTFEACTGSVGTTCTIAHTNQPDLIHNQFDFDATNNNWLIATRKNKVISNLPLGGGTVTTFETTDQNIAAFKYRKDASNNEYVYYCSTNGLLYKRDIINDTEVNLAFPSSNMKCVGNAIQYHSGRDSVIFIYEENSLYGIAEYKNP